MTTNVISFILYVHHSVGNKIECPINNKNKYHNMSQNGRKARPTPRSLTVNNFRAQHPKTIENFFM